jgi:hypothetical protein
MKVVLTAALAFSGDEKMGPILFDQSRLYPVGSGNAEPASPQPPA